MRNSHLSFWLLTIAIGTGLTVPTLIRDGMFMDAVLYTSVAHNLSQGIGTFWFPQFSAHNIAGLDAFHEQPPLVFGIQAVFFMVFGSSMYVERLYTFITLVISAWLISRTWKNIPGGSTQQAQCSWLPVLLWITVPVCFWSYSNNMHENTMSVFCVCAVLLTLLWLEQSRIYYLIAAGIAIFLATFCKGLPGFFPVAVPLLYFLSTDRISLKRALGGTGILVAIPSAIYGLILLSAEARESLGTYFFERVLQRIDNLPTVEHRLYIVGRLFMELLPQILLTVLIVFFSRSGVKKTFKNSFAWFFILVGLAGSVPLSLTLVQKSFYLVPALPFFAIGLGLFISPVISKWTQNLQSRPFVSRCFLVAGVTGLMISLFASALQVGKFSRNKELLQDVYTIGTIVPRNEIVSIDPELWNQWDLQCYLMRYFGISLEKSVNRTYFLNPGKDSPPPRGYSPVPSDIRIYDLYRRQ